MTGTSNWGDDIILSRLTGQSEQFAKVLFLSPFPLPKSCTNSFFNLAGSLWTFLWERINIMPEVCSISFLIKNTLINQLQEQVKEVIAS
jgi:hypothetical protein